MASMLYITHVPTTNHPKLYDIYEKCCNVFWYLDPYAYILRFDLLCCKNIISNSEKL